jgi:hypothetical protein
MLPPFAPGCQRTSLVLPGPQNAKKPAILAGFWNFLDFVGINFGGAERDRTADLLVANEALSQLSYSPPPSASRPGLVDEHFRSGRDLEPDT